MQPQVKAPVTQNKPESKYRCKKCRHVLFSQILHSDKECTSIFIGQPSWLNTNEMENEIKFNCPKCQTKLGDVIFSGKKCSCGQWITPGFQVLKNKVDEVKDIKSLGLA